MAAETQAGGHKLHTKWVLWFQNSKFKKPNENWEDIVKRVYEFDSVEVRTCRVPCAGYLGGCCEPPS